MPSESARPLGYVIVVLGFLYWIYVKITKPPKQLRHLPQASYFGFIKAFFKMQTYDKTAQEITLPAALKSKQGLYVIFDVNGWSVHVARPEAAKKIFYKTELFPKKDNGGGRRDTLFYRFAAGPSLPFLNGAHWKSQRMVANPAFHRSMPTELFGGLSKKLFSKIDSDMKSPVDIHNLMMRWTLDAIGLAGFDFDFDAIINPDSIWVTRYESIMGGVFQPFYLAFPTFDLPRWRKWFPERKRIHQVLDVFLDNMRTIIAAKRETLANEASCSAKKQTEKDLLTLMLEASAEGHGSMSDQELLSNLCAFFAAGHDTTANALSFAIYNLAVNPEIQQKAREEAIRVLGNSPEDIVPTNDQIREMSYINMVIKENMRNNGTAATVISRIPQQDTDLEGVFIPKGTPVVVDIYEIMHNPTVWSDPHKFNPERFVTGGEADQVAKLGMSWVPFGHGSRQCIGMNFSLAEQRVLLPMLLRKYNLSLPDDSVHKEKLVMTGYGILKPKDLHIVLKKRY
ncbi:cytochrome P-450 cyp509A1 [Fennellomyces sp. T-0311]|nr:cytochrome P-450 cyp509A1 [Fennellomyces sp. T-0311]